MLYALGPGSDFDLCMVQSRSDLGKESLNLTPESGFMSLGAYWFGPGICFDR